MQASYAFVLLLHLTFSGPACAKRLADAARVKGHTHTHTDMKLVADNEVGNVQMGTVQEHDGLLQPGSVEDELPSDPSLDDLDQQEQNLDQLMEQMKQQLQDANAQDKQLKAASDKHLKEMQQDHEARMKEIKATREKAQQDHEAEMKEIEAEQEKSKAAREKAQQYLEAGKKWFEDHEAEMKTMNEHIKGLEERFKGLGELGGGGVEEMPLRSEGQTLPRQKTTLLTTEKPPEVAEQKPPKVEVAEQKPPKVEIAEQKPPKVAKEKPAEDKSGSNQAAPLWVALHALLVMILIQF